MKKFFSASYSTKFLAIFAKDNFGNIIIFGDPNRERTFAFLPFRFIYSFKNKFGRK